MARADSPTAMVPAPGRAVLEKPTTRAPRVTRIQELTPRAGTSAAMSGMVSEAISDRRPAPCRSAAGALPTHPPAPTRAHLRRSCLDRCVTGVLGAQNPDNATVNGDRVAIGDAGTRERRRGTGPRERREDAGTRERRGSV